MSSFSSICSSFHFLHHVKPRRRRTQAQTSIVSPDDKRAIVPKGESMQKANECYIQPPLLGQHGRGSKSKGCNSASLARPTASHWATGAYWDRYLVWNPIPKDERWEGGHWRGKWTDNTGCTQWRSPGSKNRGSTPYCYWGGGGGSAKQKRSS